ncbi:MAG: nitroreductase family protein [Anaerolineales bacterium]|nr:nitroreductase family protein [Anaerolineales bacterium]
MDALEAIRKRRTIRKYTGAPIPKPDLETIVDAGRLAATGSNKQPWDFVVVTDRAAVAGLNTGKVWIEQAAAVIAVVMDPQLSRWWVEDGAAAIQNMLLASTALGYGGCWVEGDMLPHEEEFKAKLGIPPAKRILALVPIGIPAETPVKEKKPLAEVIHWEKY